MMTSFNNASSAITGPKKPSKRLYQQAETVYEPPNGVSTYIMFVRVNPPKVDPETGLPKPVKLKTPTSFAAIAMEDALLNHRNKKDVEPDPETYLLKGFQFSQQFKIRALPANIVPYAIYKVGYLTYSKFLTDKGNLFINFEVPSLKPAPGKTLEQFQRRFDYDQICIKPTDMIRKGAVYEEKGDWGDFLVNIRPQFEDASGWFPNQPAGTVYGQFAPQFVVESSCLSFTNVKEEVHICLSGGAMVGGPGTKDLVFFVNQIPPKLKPSEVPLTKEEEMERAKQEAAVAVLLRVPRLYGEVWDQLQLDSVYSDNDQWYALARQMVPHATGHLIAKVHRTKTSKLILTDELEEYGGVCVASGYLRLDLAKTVMGAGFKVTAPQARQVLAQFGFQRKKAPVLLDNLNAVNLFTCPIQHVDAILAHPHMKFYVVTNHDLKPLAKFRMCEQSEPNMLFECVMGRITDPISMDYTGPITAALYAIVDESHYAAGFVPNVITLIVDPEGVKKELEAAAAYDKAAQAMFDAMEKAGAGGGAAADKGDKGKAKGKVPASVPAAAAASVPTMAAAQTKAQQEWLAVAGEEDDEEEDEEQQEEEPQPKKRSKKA